MWDFDGVPEQAGWLTFEPVRILYEFDVPCIFICRDVPGNTYLAYLCGEEPHQVVRYLVVPCSADLEQRLVTGRINLRDALTQSRAWIFDLDNRWEPVQSWRVNADSLPSGVLPRSGVMLYAHLPQIVEVARARPWANEIEMPYSSPDQGRWIQTGTGVAHA
jgi:hypothetical protein